jgi:uncharacterized peroxidase-related enzyme
MARVSHVSSEQVPAEHRAFYEKVLAYGPFANQLGAIAHRPPIMNHTYGMLLELREEGVLPRRYLELALVAVSLVNKCEYCVTHHAPFLSVEGISPAGCETLLDFENHPELDEVDKLVVEYSIKLTNDFHRVRDSMFDRLKAHFTEPQIVELTWRAALCGAFNRFNDVLQLDIEEEASEVHAAAE